jgi:hypothetical protein
LFREPVSALIIRSHELRVGRLFSPKAKPLINPKAIEDMLRLTTGSTTTQAEEQVDTRRLVIRDSKGRPRTIDSAVEPSRDKLS